MSALPDISQLFTPAQLEAIRQLIDAEVERRLSELKPERDADDEETSRYMTRKEAADYLRTSLRNLDKICKSGGLEKLYDDSGRVRLLRQEVVGYFNQY